MRAPPLGPAPSPPFSYLAFTFTAQTRCSNFTCSTFSVLSGVTVHNPCVHCPECDSRCYTLNVLQFCVLQIAFNFAVPLSIFHPSCSTLFSFTALLGVTQPIGLLPHVASDSSKDDKVESQFEKLDDRHQRHSKVQAERSANVREVRLHLKTTYNRQLSNHCDFFPRHLGVT